MNLFQRIFGYRSKLSASSSITYPEALDLAQLLCERCKMDGRDVVLMPMKNTNSMLPTVDSNAVILLEKCGFSLLREGDIVTYRPSFADNLVILHRLNERRKTGWMSVGDANGTIDPELVTPTNFDRRLCGLIYGAKSADTDR